MKLVDITYPNCGANMVVYCDANSYVCEYCSTTILINDEMRHVKFDNAEEAGY